MKYVVALALTIALAGSFASTPAADAPPAAPSVDPKLADEFQNAIFFKDVDKIRKTLDVHPDLAKAELSYQLALQRACDTGSQEIVQLLIDRGADVKAVNTLGLGARSNAAASGNVPIVKFLIEKGADPKKEDGLLGGSKTGEMAEYLISIGLDVKAMDKRGNTALHNAADWGRKDVMDVLLKHGADIEALGSFKKRPLHVAAGSIFNDSLATVQYLVEKGADVKSRGFIHETALHESAFHGQIKTAEWLIEKGLNVNEKNDNGETPMDLATKANDKAMIEMLKKHGAK